MDVIGVVGVLIPSIVCLGSAVNQGRSQRSPCPEVIVLLPGSEIARCSIFREVGTARDIVLALKTHPLSSALEIL
jgi:hypothetical protein